MATPVSWWASTRYFHGRWIAIGGASLGGIVILLGFLFFTHSDPLSGEASRLNTQLTDTESQLARLESEPTPVRLNPGDALRQMAERSKIVEQSMARNLNDNQIEEAKRHLQTLENLSRQAPELAKAVGNPQSSANDHTGKARALASDFQATIDAAHDLLEKARSGSKVTPQLESISERAQEGLGRTARLMPKRVSPPKPIETQEWISGIQAALQRARDRIRNQSPPFVAPFAVEEATLIVATNSDLAESLVVPLLKRRGSGEAVAGPDGIWFYTSKASGPTIERVLVKSATEKPLRDLIENRADLVVTDTETTADDRQGFKALFPDQNLESRSFSEVVALDALTLLANPSSLESQLTYEQAQATQWIGGPIGTVEHSVAQRFGFPISHPAERPAEAVLREPAGRALGVYHRDGRIKAKRLAYTPGGQAPALEPSPFTIASKDYKFSFDIVAYTTPRSRPTATSLVTFMINNQGQDVISEQGFVDRRLRGDSTSPDPRILAILGKVLNRNVTGASRLSTDIRFPVNVHELSSRAQADLEQLPSHVAREFPRSRVVILGFTDNTGSDAHNLTLSVNRAASVASLVKPAIPSVLHSGLGALLPIDNNSTDLGRERNRRAEVWIVAE